MTASERSAGARQAGQTGNGVTMAAAKTAPVDALSGGRTESDRAQIDGVLACLDHPLLWPADYLDASPALPALPLIFWLTETFRPERALSLGDASGVAHLAFCQAAERLALDTECLTDGGADGGGATAAAEAACARHGAGRSVLLTAGARLPRDVDLIAAELPGDGPASAARLADLTARLSDGGGLLLYGAGLNEALLAAPLAGDLRVLVFGADAPRVALCLAPGAPEVLAELAALPCDSAERRAFNAILDRLGEIHRLELQARGPGPRPAAEVQQVAPPPSRHAEDVERLLAKLIEIEDDRQALRQGRAEAAPEPPEAGPAEAAEAMQATEGAQAGIAERLQELEAEIAFLQHRVLERDKEIKAIRASTSWRVTAPVRVVVRLLRGLRGG